MVLVKNANWTIKNDLKFFSYPILINDRFVIRKKKKAKGFPNDIKNAPTKPNNEPINSLSILILILYTKPSRKSSP